MRVFIAGATGVLGRRLVAECADRGHEVVGLVRDDSGADLVRERGGTPHHGDVFEPETLVEGAAGADVIVNAATKIPTDTNPSPEEWELNDRVRREGTVHLVGAAATAGAERFIQQSIVWVARQPDGSHFDETAETHPDPSTQSAVDAEETVRESAASHEFDPVILRGGYFYAPDTAHTHLFGERLLAGKLPIVANGLLGRRDATLSFIHVDDIARAYGNAIEGRDSGIFHVVDDEPTTYARFVEEFADRLDASSPRRIPAWLAKFFLNDNLVRLLTNPIPTDNDRFSEAFDWQPEYPTIETGLDQVVDTWEENGVIEERGDGYEWAGDSAG